MFECWKPLFGSVLFLFLQNALVFTSKLQSIVFAIDLVLLAFFPPMGNLGSVRDYLGSSVSTQYLKYSLAFIRSFPVHPNSSLLSFTLLLFLTLLSVLHIFIFHFFWFLGLWQKAFCLSLVQKQILRFPFLPKESLLLGTTLKYLKAKITN